MRRIPPLALWLVVLALGACSPQARGATPVYSYQVVRTYPHDPNAFTEGLFLRDGFVYGLDDFEARGEFSYAGEGWALTRDDKRLIMSDGTSRLRFLDPETLKETGGITVTDEGKPVDQLNELEWVKGEILANIWQTDRIARIDPTTGHVKGWIDLTGLLPANERASADVLNGIAYDAKGDRLIVTGKLWPRMYEIKLVKR